MHFAYIRKVPGDFNKFVYGMKKKLLVVCDM